MCGIAGMVGPGFTVEGVRSMVSSQRHRGPDAEGVYIDPGGTAGLGHNRLSIIDLSDAGWQPMSDPSGRYRIVFNGEVYNYRELRRELEADFAFRSRTDTEVLLAAYVRWGPECLHRLIGMFAFAVWDETEKTLFAARDRFGVKPLYYATRDDGTLVLASEMKALHAAGIPARPDPVTWATYLAIGLYEHTERTFWEGVRALGPGQSLRARDGRQSVSTWYDLAARLEPGFDRRPERDVEEEYLALLGESLRLRFRSDVPVGVSLSGGLDSSVLLALVRARQGPEADVAAFTFVTGDDRYDELPWVDQMLTQTGHRSHACLLRPEEVPGLAASVQTAQDEPFGGLPTLAYARLFERARAQGVIVILDGQGLDEQWAGYDYYALPDSNRLVQGTGDRPTRAECLRPEFRAVAEAMGPPALRNDRITNRQLWDIRRVKLPRALRFSDRASMRSGVELREPFLDHRLVELALRQSPDRKVRDGVHKWLLRRMAGRLIPAGVSEAPKRPVQTPQREWLRGALNEWAWEQICTATHAFPDWLDPVTVAREWRRFRTGEGDNSFFVWQWISLGLLARTAAPSPAGNELAEPA
jgi:asparagine synthase (glutamine-hydrolysing)